MGLLLRILAVFASLAAPLAAGADPGNPAPVRGVAEIAGKLVPLPPGDWLTVAETVERRGADGFAVRVLVRADGGLADALVIARANLASRPAPLPAPSGLPVSAAVRLVETAAARLWTKEAALSEIGLMLRGQAKQPFGHGLNFLFRSPRA